MSATGWRRLSSKSGRHSTGEMLHYVVWTTETNNQSTGICGKEGRILGGSGTRRCKTCESKLK